LVDEPDPLPPEEPEGSLTVDPLVVWGAWAADRHAEDPTPSAWIVLGVLIGLPVVLIIAVAIVSHH
jgi:hypothetical protein